MISIYYFFLFWCLAIICGAAVGLSKNRGVFGFMMGFLLGWIGVLIVACFPKNGKKCRFCGGVLNQGYSVCPHCGKDNRRSTESPCRGGIEDRVKQFNSRIKLKSSRSVNFS